MTVHTDQAELQGVAWRRLLARAGPRVHVQRRPRSLHVFGHPYRTKGTEQRVVALRVLM